MRHFKLQLRLQLTRFQLWLCAKPRRDPIADCVIGNLTFDDRAIAYRTINSRTIDR